MAGTTRFLLLQVFFFIFSFALGTYFFVSSLQGLASQQQLHNDFKIVTPTRDDAPMNVLPFPGAEGDHHFHNDYEDEGVFDFEL